MPRPSSRALLLVPVLASTAVVALAGPALAHASLDKASVPASTEQTLQARVPVERAGEMNVKVIVEVPVGFVAMSCAPKLGWTCTVVKENSPARSAQITWTRQSGIDAIDLLDFVVRTPARAGTYGVDINQFYSSGEVAQWDDAPGGDQPAPQLTVTAAGSAPSANPEATPHDDGGAKPAATTAPSRASAAPAAARAAGTPAPAAPAPAPAAPAERTPASAPVAAAPADDAPPPAAEVAATSGTGALTDASVDPATETVADPVAGAAASVTAEPAAESGSSPLVWAVPLVLLAAGGAAAVATRSRRPTGPTA